MTVETKTFALSDRFIANRWRLLILIGAILALSSTFAMLNREGFDIAKINVMAWGLVMALLVGIILLVGLFMAAKWRQMRVQVGPDGLVRAAGAAQQTVPWTDIVRLRVRTDGSDQPKLLEIMRRSGRTMSMLGVEPMAELVASIKAKLPPTATVETKRLWFDWENLWVMAALLLGAMLVGLLLLAGELQLPHSYRQWLYDAWLIAFALYFLLYRPMSRLNPGFRTIEVALASLSILIGLADLIAGVL